MAQIGNIIITDARASASLPGVTTGSCFMTFRNASNSSDWLTSASPGPNQPFNMAMPMTFAIDSNGTWSMITLTPNNSQFFQIAPGVPTVLTPGYAHIMLMNLSSDLVPGQTLQLELGFQNSGSGIIDVPVIS